MPEDQGNTGQKQFNGGLQMADITVQQISLSGLTESAATAATAAGDTVLNNGRTFIEVTDGATTNPTVTIASQVDCNQGYTHDVVVTVPSGEAKIIGPFPPNRFNNASGQIEVTYDDDTSVTIAAFTL